MEPKNSSSNGEFTVNIALIENGLPIGGVVYAPARNLFYGAEMDATGNWQKQVPSSKFQVSSNSEAKGSLTPGASSQTPGATASRTQFQIQSFKFPSN